MFCWYNKRILLHKYQQNIFIDLTTVFSVHNSKWWQHKISVNSIDILVQFPVIYKHIRFINKYYRNATHLCFTKNSELYSNICSIYKNVMSSVLTYEFTKYDTFSFFIKDSLESTKKTWLSIKYFVISTKVFF